MTTGIGFTPLYGRWVECESCDAPDTLGATPTPHRGRWHARVGSGQIMRYDIDKQIDTNWPASTWNHVPVEGVGECGECGGKVPGMGRPHRAGVGYAQLPGNTTAIAAANDVLGYFDASGPCSQQSIPAVLAFQNAYNASGLPGALTADGKYGGNTQAALQAVIDQAEAGLGPTQAAPPNCFGMAVPVTPAPNPTPAPVVPATPTPGVTNMQPMSGGMPSWAPWAIGATVLAGAGYVGYTYYKSKR